MKLVPLFLFLASCASDPYLYDTLDCVNKAVTRAAADACRAKLQDAGIVIVFPRDASAAAVSDAAEVSHGG